MDPDMIRPRKCKPCPPPPPPPTPAPPSTKKEASPPPPSPQGENVTQGCQHDCCNFRGHPLPPPPPPSLWPCHPPPLDYWNDDVDRFSRMRRVKSLEMSYRMNFRDPLDDFHEDHTQRRCMALQPPSACHGPPPMLMGHHREQPPPLLGHHRGKPPPILMGHHRGEPPPMLMGHHRGQPPLLLRHHCEPPTSHFPPPGDYGYQHGYYDNPNGCTIM